jgi:lipopolysaccharide biosynthesis glycosyltransferase
MKNVVFLMSSKEYITHAKALVGALRNIGKWIEDIAILGAQFSKEDIEMFKNAGITVFAAKEKMGGFTRFDLFTEIVKSWDRVLILGLDFVVFNDINCLFEQPGEVLCEEQPFDFTNQFQREYDQESFALLEKEVDIRSLTFCCDIMRYDTKLITQDTLTDLWLLREKYKKINHINGVVEGADQPILNVYFYKKWKNIERSHFIGTKTPEDDIVLSHTTHWYAPWLEESQYRSSHYIEGLHFFETNLQK